jgi:hypothetical protein
MHPNLSKEKLYPSVKVFCERKKLSCPKPRTIGRIIADAPNKIRSRPESLDLKVRDLRETRPQKVENPKDIKPLLRESAAPLTWWSTYWMELEDT